MERHFETELAELKKNVLMMGLAAEEAMIKAVEALKSLDKESAEKIILDDKYIDDYELKIDEMCLELLALQQPMAKDLRFVTMTMKITTDLERIADLAVDIAQRVIELSGEPLLKPLVDIPKLTILAQEMTKDSVTAFIDRDEALAKNVILRDPEADTLRNAVQRELIEDYTAKDKSVVSRAVPLLLVARHLERICDHATNIAEDVIFLIKGDVVKHHPEKLNNK